MNIVSIAGWSRSILPQSSLGDIIFLVVIAVTVFSVLAGFAILCGWLERKLIARVHSRIGPMYTGPAGILQTAADALKFLQKEVIFPVGSDRLLFAIVPFLMFLPVLVATVFLPLGSYTVVQSDYSLLFVLALLAFTPIAVLVGSWASNSKYSTLGGLRSAGMAIAFEVLVAVSAASVILTTHSLDINVIVGYQASHVWLIIVQPLAFVLFLIAAVASVERNPFDLTEAESEIVGGWKTEYGGVYFSFTFLAEYAKLLIIAMLITSLFLGGWMGPLGDVGFIIKVLVLVVLSIYIRATAMRYRIDQLLHTLWTRLIPLAFLNVIITIVALAVIGGR